MKTIIVAAATAAEMSLLIRITGAQRRSAPGVSEFYEWGTGDQRVILLVTGMGKVNTASALTAMISRFSPGLLINTGCAGAYNGSALALGDLAVATAEIYGDEGVLTPSGWKPLDYIGIPLVKVQEQAYFNELPLSLPLVEKAVRFANIRAIPLHSGKFVTVSTCSGTVARGEELSTRFRAICENMEGAAAAHVALMHGIDFLEIRGISNMVEDRDLSRWDIVRAAENAQRFIYEFIKEQQTCRQ
jgi:futalosine hydrolase